MKILPKQWLKADQRAQVRGLPDNGALNDALELVEDRLLTCYREHRALGQLPSIEILRAAVIPVPTETSEAAVNFWQHLAEWEIQKRTSGLLNTARTYATAARHLREFAKASKYTVDFDTITPAFADKFTAYLVGPAHLTDNTVSKILTRVKLFMKWAGGHGLHTNTYYPKLTWARREPDVMTLTAEELADLAALPLLNGGYLDNAAACSYLAVTPAYATLIWSVSDLSTSEAQLCD